MNGIIAILLVLVAVNPVRRRYELPANRTQVAVGAALTLTVLLGLGVGGEALLDALDISVPTFRVAVGLVLAIRATVAIFRRLPSGGPAQPGGSAALAPVFFPVLFRPEVALVGVLVGADAGVGWLLLGAVPALLDPVFWAERNRNARMDRALGIVLSIGAVVLAIDLIVDGVFAL